MGYHVTKNEVQMAWMDNRDQVKLDLKKLLRRVENAVLSELDGQFTEALSRGEILELRPAEETLRGLVASHAKALEA